MVSESSVLNLYLVRGKNGQVLETRGDEAR
jgi:hypothetical protein